jgi:hypothetical protein
MSFEIEACTFTLPCVIGPETLKANAVSNYQKRVKLMADFLGLPAEESEFIKVNEHSTTINILERGQPVKKMILITTGVAILLQIGTSILPKYFISSSKTSSTIR